MYYVDLIDHSPLRLFRVTVKQTTQINSTKNPNWQVADQLAMHDCSREEVNQEQPGTKLIQLVVKVELEIGITGFQVQRPRCLQLHCNLTNM